MSAEAVAASGWGADGEVFGRGLYGTALAEARTDGPATTMLVDVTGRVSPVPLDVGRWMAEPTDADRALLAGLDGRVLDVGCGPGRMLRAAQDRTLAAAGVDLNPGAVALARARGGLVYEQSVFDPMPAPWNGFLLLDGNIGIGGDPRALLRRLRELAVRGARLLVETDPEPDREQSYRAVLCDASGRVGEEFAWSRLGSAPLHALARSTGWSLEDERRLNERGPEERCPEDRRVSVLIAA